jgi:peptidoglycan/LPS O-acetylase OafA/YrhL
LPRGFIQMELNQLYFKPLTGLRFVAALMVFITHLMPRNFGTFINNLIAEFQVGVPIFFVLSGFLIAYRYFDAGQNMKGGVFNYFVNRAVRILPLYLLVTVANCLWYQLDTKEAILNLTLLHGFFAPYVFSPLPHTWSLTVECTFYALVPLIFFLIRNKIGIAVQTIFFVLLGLSFTYLFHHVLNTAFWGDFEFMALLTFFGRCFEFLAGVQLALYIKNRKSLPAYPALYTYASIATFILIMVVLSLSGGIYTDVGLFLHNLLFPVCIVWMIYGLIASRNVISTLLGTPVFQLLGNSSYAFFLIHYGFWQQFMVEYLIVDFFFELAATLLLSIILYKVIEEPLLKLVKMKLRLLNRRDKDYVTVKP